MKTSIVMTIIGKDQPGLVEAVSAIIEAQQGNWEESHMARLAGQFAGILRVEVDADRVDSLKDELGALERRGLSVVVEQAGVEPQVESPHVFGLELVGQDHPGIVHQISKIIAKYGVNVEELESECVDAPWSGEQLFKATVRLSAPDMAMIDQLKHELEQIAAELMVDVSLKTADEQKAKSDLVDR